jgi:RimJ/RimL family protein N-acetyltransferase
MLRWHRAPHASPWFDGEPQDLEGTEREYGPTLDGLEPTFMHAIEIDGRDVGYIQHYHVASYPEYANALGIENAAAIDYVIGDPEYVGRGYGPSIIRRYVEDFVLPAHPTISCVLSSPSPENARSIRALEKAGFRQLRTARIVDQDERICVFEVSARRLVP